jgi:hypothetical protein
MCLSACWGQIQAQSLVDAYTPTSLPPAQGWQELRFDNSLPWEQDAKDLLVAPGDLTAVVGTALKLKANKTLDQYGYPQYSQLGWYKPNTGFTTAIGYTVEFKAKVVNSEDGAFTVSGVSGEKGFRLKFSNSLLVEQANVLDSVRVLSTADNTDAFHTYRVAVTPSDKVIVWRDGIQLAELPLQPFTLDNIIDDGGFENGASAAAHGWVNDTGTPGDISVSNDPAHVHTGKYGLYVDKGTHNASDYIPMKWNATYDMSAWGKTINYPSGDGHWRDFNGYVQPGNKNIVYFIGASGNNNWVKWNQALQGGGGAQRYQLGTPTGAANDNQTAYDDLLYTERISPSRIPYGAVNLFPNGDFEDPDYDYFPAGDPRNDTVIVNLNKFDYYKTFYPSDDYVYDADQTPFWHPFFKSRVRVQEAVQPGNNEAGSTWARSGKYALRYFNSFSDASVQYGGDYTSSRTQGKNTILDIEQPLEVGKTYTFSFWYKFAKWGGDHLKLRVYNGTDSLWYKNVTGEGSGNEKRLWSNVILTFTTTAENNTLRIFTENTNSDPGLLYFDDFFLFEGEPLPEYDNTHLFFGKQTSVKEADVEIEYVKTDATGAYAPDGTTFSSPYEKKSAALMTTWGETLQATDPILDEYPRPQLKRDNWTNLNGIWDFTRKTTAAFGTYSPTDLYRQQILVPYPVESALSGIKDGEYNLQTKTYSYKRIVSLAKPADDKRVILNFGAVDWESYVFVNGTEVAHHKGGFDPFSIDITDALDGSGSQEIVVQVFDPTRGGQPAGKQNPSPSGDQYSPATGIWQTVWTETVSPTYVTNLELTPVDNAAVKVKVEAANAEGATATVKVLDGTTEVASADVAVGTETSIAIASPKLWSPNSPFLYNVTVELKKAGATTDEVSSYFGLRKIEVRTLRDKPFVYLNGEPAFTYATLDHGYYPDGLFTPASYAAMRFDLNKLKEIGFNGVRKFEKIEPAIWYYLADSIGLLVWQDIPAAYEATPIAELSTEAARKANFLRETAAMTKAIRNFPSVVAWIGFNDGWGRYDMKHVENTVNLFRSLNDGRLVVPESRDDSYELGDVVSSNGTPPVLHTNAYNQRASVCFVTGVYPYAIAGHTWNSEATSDIKNDSLYAIRLKAFADAAKNLTLSNISGLAMVQTTDVENEINGLMTYDRKVYKAGHKADSILRASIAFMKEKIAAPILKTSAQGGELWKYKAGAAGSITVPADWYSNIALDESGWSEDLSGFGSSMGWFEPKTWWRGDNKEIYLRKKVNIPALPAGDALKFTLAYDEDYEFYINGQLAHANTGYTTSYVGIEIDPVAAAAINYGGDNLFAFHVIQTNGGSAIDLGLTAETLSNPITYEPTPEPIVWKDIATAQDWLDISNDLNGFYRLTADIDMTSTSSYVPIGNSDNPFKGYIDGQNYTVACPEVRSSESDRMGLFGYADGAHFVNLRFTAGFVEGKADVGILLGRGKGIHVEHVVFDQDPVYATEVYGADHVGIIAGLFESGKLSTIKDVYVVDGLVSSSAWQAAGLVGIINDTRIINSYFTGTVQITAPDYLTTDNRDASGIVSRTEGGKNYFNGVMSLAEKIQSASGNEFISYNGGGYLVIDSATCFTRDDVALDPIYAPNRGGQFARANEALKRPIADFQSSALYKAAGWDFSTGGVWGIPAGGGFPIFQYLGGLPDAIKAVKAENNLKVYSAYGNIVLSSDQDASVWVYNLQGALVERIDFVGTQQIALPKGIYIVKSAVNGNVKAVKVINK